LTGRTSGPREGFIVARSEHGETDLVVSILLEDGSVRRAMAKGARKSTRRFAAGLSAFVRYRVVFGRPPARQGANAFPRLDEATVVRAYAGVLDDLRRTSAAGFASVLSSDLAREVSHDAGLFALFVEHMGRIEHADGVACGGATVRFALRALEHAGFPIALDACVRCGKPAPDNALVHVRAAEGGIVCAKCSGTSGGGARSGEATLRAADRRALRRVQTDGADAAFEPWMLTWLVPIVGAHAPHAAANLTQCARHWAT